MKKYVSGDEDFDLWMFLAQTRRAMLKARRKELARYSISPRQSAIMFLSAVSEGRTTPAEIARVFFREPHSISGMLDRMEERGMVKKVKDLDRKNMIRVVLTDKGREAYKKTEKRDSIHKIISSLSQQERQQFKSILRKLQDAAVQTMGFEGELPYPP